LKRFDFQVIETAELVKAQRSHVEPSFGVGFRRE
jgi:hypothetical protein